MNLFQNRKLVIATKHGKEQVISPLFTQLGMSPVLDLNLDTDLLGTFTGEIKRSESVLATARKKCDAGVELTGCDLAIASEGSFGPHPLYGFVPCNEEVLLFKDYKNNFELVQKEVSLETNFNSSPIKSFKELKVFAEKIKFPSHALIFRYTNAEGQTAFVKGIKSVEHLKETYQSLSKITSSMVIETDMRAMNNPTRMQVIANCAKKLFTRLTTACPNCNFPGFGTTQALAGLPCGSCGLPTRSTLAYIHTCSRCQFTLKENFPHKKEIEDPMYCDFCNP